MRLLIFSDIHGDTTALRKLIDTDVDYYFAAGDLATFSRGLEKAGPILAERGDRVLVIPGNHESVSDIADFCEQYGLRNFHGQTMQAAGYAIAGLGYSNPTPFHTPGEYTEVELGARLAAFDGMKPLVLICHCPPSESKLDCAAPGRHLGSAAVRDFIEREQPDYFFCGHIHEAAGASDQFGHTRGFNVGKKGYLLEL